MWYGLYETILNAKNLLVTKLFYPKARLIRFPFYARNRKNMVWGSGFTCGYRCRLECVSASGGQVGKISFGNNVKIGDDVHIASARSIYIGDNVLMASHIFISDLEHGKYSGNNQTSPEVSPDVRELNSEEVRIGHNVWIGENVVILKGVTIGDGCVIGANSVVNRSVPEKTIVVGAPARVIKKYDSRTNSWERVNE